MSVINIMMNCLHSYSEIIVSVRSKCPIILKMKSGNMLGDQFKFSIRYVTAARGAQPRLKAQWIQEGQRSITYKKVERDEARLNDFILRLELLRLNPGQVQLCEEYISKEELGIAQKSMNNGSAGLTATW